MAFTGVTNDHGLAPAIKMQVSIEQSDNLNRR